MQDHANDDGAPRLRSLRTLGQIPPDEVRALVAAVHTRGEELPHPVPGVALHAGATRLAQGTVPARWLEALREKGWAVRELAEPWPPAREAEPSRQANTPQVLELVTGTHFAPRTPLEDQRATRWWRLVREDPLAKPNLPHESQALLNLGGVLEDPLAALAWLARIPDTALGKRPVALLWSGAEAEADNRAFAPVAPVHALLVGLARLGTPGLLLAQPEGFELAPAVLAQAERLALSTHELRLETAYTPDEVSAWLGAQPQEPLLLPARWFPLRYYDNREEGLAAAQGASPEAWCALTDEALAQPPPQAKQAAFAALLTWCLAPLRS